MLEHIKQQLEHIKSNMKDIEMCSINGNLTPSEIETCSTGIQLSADFLMSVCSTIDKMLPNERGYGICDVCGKRVSRFELRSCADKDHCKDCYRVYLTQYGI